MPTAVNTDTHTQALRVTSTPRRFYGRITSDIFDENNLLLRKTNTIILGDPGAGKTTTLKRLIRSVIYINNDNDESNFDLPILIVARDLGERETLNSRIFDILGAKYTKISTSEKDENSKDSNISKFIRTIIEKMRLVIFIDELDEIHPSARKKFETQMRQFTLIDHKSIIIATCRTGDYSRIIESFDVVEIMPLSDIEIEEITRRWASNPKQFLKETRKSTYRDLFTRPLYLCQIILTFNSYGTIALRPSDLCRRILTLMLERWDRERGISRESIYTNFDTEQKQELLAHVAFELFASGKGAVFDDSALMFIYTNIREKFGLPAGDARAVVDEIESHSGILIQSSLHGYEFSHLSLQETLAAHYLVRQPTIGLAIELIYKYPAIVAIATCLSSDSSEYFSELVYTLDKSPITFPDQGALANFLSRLNTEQPLLQPSTNFGWSYIDITTVSG